MTASPSRRQAEPATDYISVERNFTEVCVSARPLADFIAPTNDAFVEPRSFPCWSGVIRIIVPARPRDPPESRCHGPARRACARVEPLLALAVGKLDLVLRQVRARLDGQAGKPGRGRVEDPSHPGQSTVSGLICQWRTNVSLVFSIKRKLLESSAAAPSNETRIAQAPVAERPVALPPARRWSCNCGARYSP